MKEVAEIYYRQQFSNAQNGLQRNRQPKQFITNFMGIIFFGSKQTPIGYEGLFVKCPCSETHHWADVMVISRYYHIYWLPMFPFDKEANLICKKCGLKRFGLSFDARLFNNFEEVRSKFRHPWYTYAGIGLFSLIVLGVIAASAL